MLRNSVTMSTAVEASRPNIAKWGHLFSITLPDQPIYVDADPTRLEQVLLNLLNNAAKYTPQGGRIKLSVETEPPLQKPSFSQGNVAIRLDGQRHRHPRGQNAARLRDVHAGGSFLGRSQEGLGIGLCLFRSS